MSESRTENTVVNGPAGDVTTGFKDPQLSQDVVRL